MQTDQNSHNSADKRYRYRIFSWALYDWANHAYITTTATTYFPPYFIVIATPMFLKAGTGPVGNASLARDAASNVFAFTIAIALCCAAVLAPIVGTYADLTDKRKSILLWITVFGGILASSMFWLTTGMWLQALALYFLTQVIVNIALGLNSSLLPHTALPHDMNRVSSLGYAMGYIGGGLLLAGNTAVFFFAARLGISSDLAVRLAFLSVGVWWIGFTIPYALNVPEPKILSRVRNKSGSPLRDSFLQIAATIRDIRRYSELFKMLIAFSFYMEGIGAIILLATVYGAALGLPMAVLIGTLLMTQIVAFPYAILFGRIPDVGNKWRGAYLSMVLWAAFTLPVLGWYAKTAGDIGIPRTFFILAVDQIVGIIFSFTLGRFLFAGLANKINTKRAVLLGLTIYVIVPLWGYFLTTKAEFFMLGWLVGTIQGGTQALSRTIYAKLSPPAKSGEFFGLYGLSEKFAGILGPFLYGMVGQVTHSPKSSILSIVVFFFIGIWLLQRIDIEKGARVAAKEEQEVESGLAP